MLSHQFTTNYPLSQTRSEVSILKYPLGETWLLAFPFVITATPLVLTLVIAIASKLHNHLHNTAIARQRALLEKIWQISSTKL